MAKMRLLTAQQVADVLNVSRSKVYDMIAKGILPAVRMGKNIRVLESDLTRFIEEQSVPMSTADIS